MFKEKEVVIRKEEMLTDKIKRIRDVVLNIFLFIAGYFFSALFYFSNFLFNI